MYPPLCGYGWALFIPSSRTGRSYPPNGPNMTGGTWVYPPLCRNGWALCLLVLRTGRPYPPSGRGVTTITYVLPVIPRLYTRLNAAG